VGRLQFEPTFPENIKWSTQLAPDSRQIHMLLLGQLWRNRMSDSNGKRFE
jgi:hypothetical protein